MAKQDENLDLAALGGAEEKTGGNGIKKIILLAVAFVAVAALGFGAAMLFVGGDQVSPEEADELAKTVVEQPPVEELAEPLYQPLDPPFVVNASDPGSRRLMQVRMQAMSYDKEVIEKLKNNMALVRDAVIMLLSAQDFDKLGDPAEKQRLRGEIKQAIENSVKFPKGTSLETVLFTEFIME